MLSGEKKCGGGKCKVAWEEVCKPKDKGGLGVRDLEIQNRCLLQKFLIKFHSPEVTPLLAWVRENYGWNEHRDFGDDLPHATPIWRDIYKNLDSFRDATKVIIGNGAMTSFWKDLWYGEQTLALSFPYLFTHTTRPNISVQKVFAGGALFLALRPRLTAVAEQELGKLLDLMSLVELHNDIHDYRTLRGNSKPPSTSSLYLLSFQDLPRDPFAGKNWKSYAPPKCKYFLWLIHKGCLSTKARLYQRHMNDSKQCPFCPLDEDICHLFLKCPRAVSIWQEIGLNITGSVDRVEQLWDAIPSLHAYNHRIQSTVLNAVLWNIWKCRNSKVFRLEDESNLSVLLRCHDDLALWIHRCDKPEDRDSLQFWSSFFSR
ncbi:hypothetical protein ACP70R_016157 [Stipagrostis hirtigluma subsp. patula]